MLPPQVDLRPAGNIPRKTKSGYPGHHVPTRDRAQMVSGHYTRVREDQAREVLKQKQNPGQRTSGQRSGTFGGLAQGRSCTACPSRRFFPRVANSAAEKRGCPARSAIPSPAQRQTGPKIGLAWPLMSRSGWAAPLDGQRKALCMDSPREEWARRIGEAARPRSARLGAAGGAERGGNGLILDTRWTCNSRNADLLAFRATVSALIRLKQGFDSP
jgi:hypothetical protein